MYDVGAAQFRNRCQIEVSSDPKTGKDRQLHVSCEVKLPNGKVKRFQKAYNLDPVFQRVWSGLLKLHQELHGADLAVSGVSLATVDEIEVAGLGDLYRRAAKATRRIVESKAVKSLRDTVVKVAPYVTEAAEFLPYGDKAVKIAEKAHGILVEARKGSPKAKAIISRVTSMAEDGDEKAMEVFEALLFMNGKLKEKQKAAVSGWLYNRPYRGNLAAGSFDKSSPLHLLRGAYNKGMGK